MTKKTKQCKVTADNFEDLLDLAITLGPTKCERLRIMSKATATKIKQAGSYGEYKRIMRGYRYHNEDNPPSDYVKGWNNAVAKMKEFLEDMVLIDFEGMTVGDAIELNKKAQESMGDPTIFDQVE